MKNIFRFLNGKNLFHSFRNSAQRFPLSFAILATFNILALWSIHMDVSHSVELILWKSMAALIVSFFLSVGVSLLREFQEKKQNFLAYGQAFTRIFALLFFLSLPGGEILNFENFLFFFLALLGIISFLFYSPFLLKILKNKEKSEKTYAYIYNIGSVFVSAIILGFLLTALGMIAI